MQIAVDLDDERTGGALDMSARGDIDGGLVMVPAGFVEIEGVFFHFAIAGHNAFVVQKHIGAVGLQCNSVASHLVALATCTNSKVKHYPTGGILQLGSLAQQLEVTFVHNVHPLLIGGE